MFWMVVLFTFTVILAYFGLVLPENIQTDIYWLTIAGVTAIVGERLADKMPNKNSSSKTQTIENVP